MDSGRYEWQVRRRIKRKWDRIQCFTDCTVKIDIEDLPNTAVDVFIKISEDLVLEYNLDMFQRWRLYQIVVVDGFPFRDSFLAIGFASDEWMEDYFTMNDLNICIDSRRARSSSCSD